MLNLVLYAALRAAEWTMQYVPLRLMYALAGIVGRCAYLAVPSARASILSNLRHALPEISDRELRRLAREAFAVDALNWVDTLRISRVGDSEILATVQVNGWERLEAAVGGGKGVILVMMHLGNVDLVGQYLGARGYRLTMPVERMRPPQLFQFLVKRRASRGINIVASGAASREMVRALRRGELTGIAGDRGLPGHGVRVTFFGQPALLPRGAASLARVSKAPVLMAVGVRRPRGYEGFLSAPLAVQQSGDPGADDRHNTQLIAQEMEGFIRRFPDQWLAFSPIWDHDTRPEAPGSIGQQSEAAV